MISKDSKECFLVLGVHRSGTSSLAGTLSQLGFHFGDHLLDSLPENPKGFYENRSLVDLNDKIMSESGLSWDYPYSLSFRNSLTKWHEPLKQLLQRAYKNHNKIGIKDPRICILLPLYIEVLHDLRWKVYPVVIKRDPYEIALSLKTRNRMRLFNCMALVIYYNSSLNQSLYKLPQSIQVEFSSLLINPEPTIKQLTDHFQIDCLGNFDSVCNFVDTNLYRSKAVHISVFRRKVVTVLAYSYILFALCRRKFAL